MVSCRILPKVFACWKAILDVAFWRAASRVPESKIHSRYTSCLQRIYEVDFSESSYGYCPERSCHQALAELGERIHRKRVNFVLDADKQVTPQLSGQASIIRFADAFVCTFERELDAKRFREVLVKRLDRYSHELAEEKTKLIRFGRFARRDCQRLGEGSPGTFVFLGFMHYCGQSRSGKFKLKRRTAAKKFRSKVADLKAWFRTKLTTPIAEVWASLERTLRGH